jgi:nicotinamidase-related amidase
MPLTTLDATSALIVIDLQKGIVARQTAHPASEIVDRSAQLARAFRERGLPVVLVNVTGSAPGRTDSARPKFSPTADWAEFAPELQQHPSDHIVSKQRIGAFIGTDLDEYLRQRGVTQVFLTGIATTAGVESTARSAYDYGYNVVFVEDAMTDRDPDAHRHAIEKTFPRFGETETTDNVLKQLTPGGKTI